jgi:methionine-rich copper-binding protein CopC
MLERSIMEWRERLTRIGVLRPTVTAATTHAFLIDSTPPAGSILSEAPAEVRLRFCKRIELGFSEVSVTDGSGRPVACGSVTSTLGRDDEVAIDLLSIPPGTYSVGWKAVSFDAHVTRGTFSFTVVRADIVAGTGRWAHPDRHHGP